MKVIAHDPRLHQGGWPQGPAAPAPDLRAALAGADVVSLHTPGSDRPVLGEAEFAAARDGLIVVNAARGSLIDEAALVRALRSGKVAAAGLDVLAEEPPPAGHPLFAFDQVIFTPHVAGLTGEGASRLATHSVQNVFDWFAGRLDPGLIVNGVPAPGDAGD
jgi:D-3-phosphoglycerate dehydrogenase